MKIYKVGGAVRDRLMGLEPKDTDWVIVGSSISELEKKGFQQVGKDFPVFLEPKTKEEYESFLALFGPFCLRRFCGKLNDCEP